MGLLANWRARRKAAQTAALPLLGELVLYQWLSDTYKEVVAVKVNTQSGMIVLDDADIVEKSYYNPARPYSSWVPWDSKRMKRLGVIHQKFLDADKRLSDAVIAEISKVVAVMGEKDTLDLLQRVQKTWEKG